VLPFSIALRAGVPVYEQVVYAVRRAVVTGQFRPGDSFPSVRALSQALKINPNTAHRIVAELVAEGTLTVRPGIGTIVGQGREGSDRARRALLDEESERLVVEARRAGLSLQDVLSAVRRHWARTIRRVG
jgi:GntR family transcriptional regulator